MENGNKKIAILIPAYNEGKYIGKVIEGCLKHRMDIIVVNDGSTDNTSEIVRSFPEQEGFRIILLEHSKNQGKGAALKTGFKYVIEHDYYGVITMDADIQHDPDEIPKFIETVEKEDPDIIVGSRFHSLKGMPFDRILANTISTGIISTIAGKKIRDVQSGFRYISSRVLKDIKLETQKFDLESEILLKASWQGYNIINIPIKSIYYKDFTSYFHPLIDTLKFLRLVFISIGWRIKFIQVSRKIGDIN
ncbi:MAG: glycosyltransferase family 2 protein [Actinobacteria bacterium]|nr:glycosyltransferase family 2 protein [Actinomycetota bacterium]